MLFIEKINAANLNITFDYSYEYVQLIKSMPRRTWDAGNKCWKVPTLDYEKLVSLLKEKNVEFTTIDKTKVEQKKFDLYQPKLKLFPEQEECSQFALNKDNVVLNMQIGFGKTSVALITALTLKKLKDYKSVLIIVPNTLKTQWGDEIEKFTDEKFNLVKGPKKKRIYNSNAYFTIVNYESARADINEIKKIQWDLIIVDEVVRLKNHKSKLSQTLKDIPCRQKIALTGAMLENKIEELFNILNFVRPGLFNSYTDFSNRFLIRVLTRRPFGSFWEIVGYRNLDNLRHIMNDFVIKKKLTDLPLLNKKTYKVNMEKEQRKIYKEILTDCINEVELNGNPLQKLTYLRQVCNSPATIGLTSKSSKIEELKNVLEEIGDEKVIIFTQFKKFADEIYNEIADNETCSINGEMSASDKDASIIGWKMHGRVLITTDCLSYGHNLQESHILINMDLPWNPIKLEQRIGRIWRRGQKNGCLVVNIICEDSVEENVLAILNEKLDLISEVLNENTNRIEINNREDLLKILRSK